jgi:hypothetical protein
MIGITGVLRAWVPSRTFRLVGFMHHLRRHAHRAVKAPRSAWRRVYTYREERNIRGGTTYIPISYDAPYGEEDARFWDWVLTVLVAAVALGVIVWLATTFG